MDKKKTSIIIGAVAGALVLAIGIVALSGVFRGFDPENYVTAVLDQSLKGAVGDASQLMADTSKDELEAQYEAGITSFVKSSILSGVEVDEELEGKYIVLCKKLFADMKYDTKEFKEKKDGYEVTVSYQTSNVFTAFIKAIGEERQRLNDKMENGEYRGTLEEINNQIQKDFLTNAYTLFEKCYENQEFGKKETFVFTVVKDKDGKYGMDETQISEFITKILDLDEIQG